MVLSASPSSPARPAHRYVRPPVPLFFPIGEEVPESKLHRLLLNRLLDIAEREFGAQALISSDQFMYWDSSDPGKRLAPDLAIRLGAPPLILKSWKIWELGAPHVAVE